MNRITLVTGGARSGKSAHALSLALGHEGKRAFIATAEAFDDEMRERIGNHRRERGDAFLTVEEPLDPARALKSLPGDVSVALLDCLTVWLGNLMHRGGHVDGDTPEVASFMDFLHAPPFDLVIVTNEVGMGIVPGNDMARRFRDLAGRVNRETAVLADTVVLLVCGIPVTVKGAEHEPAR
jgi:adenosylcobinamide kinase/adenosylcobinamide-phosphate guanylyltransferase